MQGYASGARAHGAHTRDGCEVFAIDTSGVEVTGVVTDAGPVRTGTVVCAAGAVVAARAARWSASSCR